MLFKAISDNEKVLKFWLKDNSLCLFQSAVHKANKIQVIQFEKLSSKTSASVNIAR